MRHLILACAALAAACTSVPAGTPPPVVTESDTALILGTGWTGELVYRDYSPPFGEVTLRTTLEVRRVPDGIELFIRYPDEPKADGASTLSISEDGRSIDGDRIVVREAMPGGGVKLVTEGVCEDDDRPATCAHTYTIAETAFGMRKTVSFGDGTPPLVRNTYAFTRP
jgi:hypothetical protein